MEHKELLHFNYGTQETLSQTWNPENKILKQYTQHNLYRLPNFLCYKFFLLARNSEMKAFNY